VVQFHSGRARIGAIAIKQTLYRTSKIPDRSLRSRRRKPASRSRAGRDQGALRRGGQYPRRARRTRGRQIVHDFIELKPTAKLSLVVRRGRTCLLCAYRHRQLPSGAARI
jgi:hypothetical protein